MTLHTQSLPVEDLRPYHRNPRQGNVAAIRESLEANGQYRAVVVNQGSHTGRPWEVLAGNHTVQAARELGWEEVAAHVVDLDDTAAARIVLADNRTSDQGTYDTDALLALLESLEDLAGTGYQDTDVDDLLAALDAAENAPREAGQEDGPDGGDVAVERNTTGFNKEGERHMAARRMLVMDMPLEAFAWMQEHLEALARQWGLQTNVEVIGHAVARAANVPAPDFHALDTGA